MKYVRTFLKWCMPAVALFSLPLVSFAHEVYVLDPRTIAHDISMNGPNPLSLIVTDFHQFILWAIMGAILVGFVFCISIVQSFEKVLYPILMHAKKYAPFVARITLGVSLLASAYYNGLFGPELPLATVFGHFGVLVRMILFVIGSCITLGLFMRESTFVALVLYIIAVYVFHTYMLTYINYLGEIILNLFLGGGLWSLDAYFDHGQGLALAQKVEPYAFPILRVCFGVALVYASWYAKLFHSLLALNVVTQYHLTNYFPFTPLFVVLGALIVETLFGLFYIFGFEIRFTALFFSGFLILSLCFFGEVVWPHLILLGVNLVFFLHGYDAYSLEGRFFKRGKLEPVL